MTPSRIKEPRHLPVFFESMNIYLQLPRHLREWLIHEYGDEQGVVRLPNGCAEHDVMELLLEKWPHDVPVETMGDGKTAIHIPEFKARKPEHYNYLTPNGKKMLTHVIYVRFRVQLWNDLHRLEKFHVSITDAIYDWMERHGIEPVEKSWESIRQMYFRQRKQYKPRKK